MKKYILAICVVAVSCTALNAQTKNTQTLIPLTERVNVQADSARVNQIIDGCWVAVGSKKSHAIQRDFTRMFNGKPSYRFELKEDDNTLSGYAKGETKGRAEFSYCYASDDFKGKPADTYKKAQIMKTVYHHGKGACPQGSSRDYEFSVYIPSTLGSDVSTIFAQWHGMPDRTLVQTPQGEVKTLTVDEFIELEKTTIFKKNVGHEKKAKLDKQGNPVKDKYGKIYARGVVSTRDIPIGNLFSLGSIDMKLNDIRTPQKLNLEVRLENSDIVNDWDFWVYPDKVKLTQGNVYTTDTLDEKAISILQEGGNVLITAAGKIKYGREVKQYFTPVFWNTSWFKMRPPHTTGIFLNDYHPLFRDFPTEYHSNLQWWELLNKAQVMQFTHFPAEFQPTIQSIDTWFISRKIGMLFEANVLNGKLIMTSMDITSQPEKRIVARQMHKAILDYMNSDAFHPNTIISPEQIQTLFTKIAGDVKSYTKDSPDELKPKIN